ncbi:MAG TPA: EAL domain-containing protein [Methylococcaceae bacterium]|nr:EAL domain-containing protein [Methylococcaceae bacterium]
MNTSNNAEANPIHVLVAEDSATQAEQLRYILEGQDYSVTVTGNGKDALAETRRRKPDILVSDIVMPEMDGYQLCREIKSDPDLQDIPVILVTSLSSVQDVIKGLECGADNFVRKPYEEQYLLSRIHYLLSNRELRQSRKVQMGMEIRLSGQRHFITAERQQILDILISIYEEAIRINKELAERQEELTHSNQTLNGLYRIAENLNHAVSEKDVAEKAVQWAMEQPGIHAAWILLQEETGFRLAAERNAPSVLNEAGGQAEAHLCLQKLLAGELAGAVNADDCTQSENAAPGPGGACPHGCIPLWTGDNRLGVMNVVKENREAFGDDELKTLLGVGNQVAVALMRARLHDRLESAVEQRTMALRASEARFSGILDIAHDAIISVDQNQRIILFNKGAERIFGYASEEVMGQPLDVLLPEALRGRHSRQVAEFDASADTTRPMGEYLEVSGLRKNGRTFPAETAISKLVIGSEKIFIAVLRDITLRKEQEARILRLNRVYAVLSGINMAIVHIKERQALIEEACRIALEHGGFKMAGVGLLDESRSLQPAAWAGTDEAYLGMLCASLESGEQNPLRTAVLEAKPAIYNDVATDPPMAAWRDKAIEKGCRAVAIFPLLVEKRVEGVIVLFAGEANFFDAEELRLLEEMAGDVGYALENIEKEKQLNYLAYFDVVTGLANRAYLVSGLNPLLAWAKRQGKRVALVVVDIDRFKVINDSLGYSGGDSLLKQFGGKLKLALKNQERLARSGSDEFAIVLSQIEEEADIPKMVEEMLSAALAEPFHIDERDLRITATGGAALFPGDGDDGESLFRNAEAALAKAKQSKERFLFYASEMNAHVSEILTLENKLRRALGNREFVLHYQPKLDLASSRMCGMEALIRWQDPDNGLIPPAQFIPILEETGMIVEVGFWALDAAAAQLRQWREQGFALCPIAVNVSSIQLREDKFVGDVGEIFRRHELKEGGIEIEITESVIMEAAQRNIDTLKALRELGVHSSIDDFGTGYSSLSYLIRLPLNRLKIDRSFIVNLAESPDSLAVVSSIISLAHSLNLKVIAEGVETDEQLKLLKLLKCDEIQGYIYSRPLPVEKIEAMFGRARP